MRRGSSLVELLVALVVLAFASAVVVPSLQLQQTRTERVAGDLAAVIGRASREAAARGVMVRFVLDTDTRHYWVGADRQWPSAVWRSGAFPAGPGLLSRGGDDLVTIRISPLGDASTATIVVGDAPGAVSIVRTGSGVWPHVEPARSSSD